MSATNFSSPSKITFWSSDSTYTNVIYITNALALKNLKTNVLYSISIVQYFIMGSDTSTPYNSTNYINVYMIAPDLVP